MTIEDRRARGAERRERHFGPDRRRGRPSRAEAPAKPLPIRLSPAEKARVELAAGINHQNVSDFARDAIVTAAEECIEAG